jgi:hypothetical protein
VGVAVLVGRRVGVRVAVGVRRSRAVMVSSGEVATCSRGAADTPLVPINIARTTTKTATARPCIRYLLAARRMPPSPSRSSRLADAMTRVGYTW